MTMSAAKAALASQETLPSAPMVSVAVTAYKSEQTIETTLRGVLAQQVSFPVEIVVGDDCSPDNTAGVVRALAEQYPGVIRLVQRTQNLGIQRNYYQTFADCRGKYVAWLDADDTWTCADKLQRQVDAMQADPKAVVSGHFVRWVTPEREVVRPRFPEMQPGVYGLSDILTRNFLPSPSVMFRREMAALLPDWYFEAAPLTDWPLYALAAQHGHILLLDMLAADYRLTPNSNFWGQGESFWYRLDARFYQLIRPSLAAAPMRKLATEQQAMRYERLAYYLRRHSDFPGAVAAAWKGVSASPLTLRNWKSLAAALANYVGLARKSVV